MLDDVNTEYQMVILPAVQDQNIGPIVLSVYNRSKQQHRYTTYILYKFEKLMQRKPRDIPTIIVGDFNTDQKFQRYHFADQVLWKSLVSIPADPLDLFMINRQPDDIASDAIIQLTIVTTAVPIQRLS